MLAVAFDTLKLARKLESAGFPPKQAQDASAALAETFSEWQASINLATREDVQRLDTRMTEIIQRLDTRITETSQRLEERIESRIAEKSAETIKWLIGISFAQASLIIAILKLHG